MNLTNLIPTLLSLKLLSIAFMNGRKEIVHKYIENKHAGQAICGMNNHPKSNIGSCLLIATRAGMFCTLSLQTGT